MKYEHKTEIPVWTTIKCEDIFLGWIKLDVDGWFKFYSNGHPLCGFDLIDLNLKLDSLNFA